MAESEPKPTTLFEFALVMAKRCAAASPVAYLDDTLRAFEAEDAQIRQWDGRTGPIFLAVWQEFEGERKARTAALAT